ncbi:MAG: FHA domain-containing protein [Lachnospiraceae bacterium]|nr:FHA domain-containing protein [Lachnospiraceae bacterium]
MKKTAYPMRGISLLLAAFMGLFLLCFHSLPVFAEEAEAFGEEAEEETPAQSTGSVKFRKAVSNDDIVKAYIRGAGTEGEISCIIDGQASDSVKGYGIGQDSEPMRTLIMLDNSLSIPSKSHTKISEVLTGIIDNHGESETFRVATFSDKIVYQSDEYMKDYTVLKSLVGNIKYENQETALTAVLDQMISDLQKEKYMGYTRIIIVSDGVDDRPTGGMTIKGLIQKMGAMPFPIYAIGCSTGKNSTQLSENLFDLSRATDTEYYVLEETDTNTITSGVSADNSIGVVEANIPQKAKTGGSKNAQIKLSGGTVSFSVEVPNVAQPDTPATVISGIVPVEKVTLDVSSVDLIEGEKYQLNATVSPEDASVAGIIWSSSDLDVAVVSEGVISAVSEGTATITAKSTDGKQSVTCQVTVEKAEEEKTFLQKFWPFLAIAGVLLVIVIVIIVVLLMKGGKKPEPEDSGSSATSFIDPSSTVIISGASDGGVHQILPNSQDKTVFRLSLVDKRDFSRSYQCELRSVVNVGRGPGVDLIIQGDGSISGKHCMLSNKSGQVFVQDLNSSNGTFLDGNRIYSETKVQPGQTLKLGGSEFLVNFTQV